MRTPQPKGLERFEATRPMRFERQGQKPWTPKGMDRDDKLIVDNLDSTIANQLLPQSTHTTFGVKSRVEVAD